MTKPVVLRTWDIETVNWNELVIACLYDGKDKYFCYNVDDIINVMIKLKGTFYAHFSGGFDNLFLLDTFNKRFKISYTNIGSRLVKISVYYKNSKKKLFDLRDSYPILPSPLQQLVKDFEVDIDITPEKWTDYKNRRDDIKGFSEEELKEYVAVDTVSLYDILVKAHDLFGVDNFKLTIASESFAELKEMCDFNSLCVPARFDAYFRKSYSGGRVEVFKRYVKSDSYDKWTQYDFKSMYSTVMSKEEYPSGIAVYTAKYRKDKLGIYTVHVKTPKKLHIPFLHTYDKDDKLCFPLGEWEGVYTSVEIEKARQLGYTITVLAGYYFTGKGRPFVSYVDKWYKVKQQAEKEGKKGLRYIAKLKLNSPYGKLGQRRIFRKMKPMPDDLRALIRRQKVLDVIPELNLVVVEDETRRTYTTVHQSSFITAYSRINLYGAFEKAHAIGGEVAYCDTDCLVTDAKLETGKQLGDLDVESTIDEAVFLFPKFYAIEENDGNEIIKSKGMSHFKKDGKTPQFNYRMFKEALHCENYSKFEESRDSIAGILEAHRRHIHHLDVIVRRRTVKGEFTKRIILDDKINTKPHIITNYNI